MDLSMMVEQQGTIVNQIERNVDDAVDHTGRAVVELEHAVEHQKSARKVYHDQCPLLDDSFH